MDPARDWERGVWAKLYDGWLYETQVGALMRWDGGFGADLMGGDRLSRWRFRLQGC